MINKLDKMGGIYLKKRSSLLLSIIWLIIVMGMTYVLVFDFEEIKQPIWLYILQIISWSIASISFFIAWLKSGKKSDNYIEKDFQS